MYNCTLYKVLFFDVIYWQLLLIAHHASVVHLTNRQQFSMVYTLVDHKMTSKNVQNSIGTWFHCQVLDILWRHFMVCKSIGHRKLPLICFLQ